jgi:hypothetical protein
VCNWRFDPDEFAHVWRETDVQALPYPVRLLETPTTAEQALSLRDRLTARLPARGDPDLSTALAIAARPQTKVVVIGATARHGTEIRILGAVVRRQAVLLVQEPGPTADFGGSVGMTMGHAARLGQLLAARLPSMRAGGEPWRSAPTQALRELEARAEQQDWHSDAVHRETDDLGRILALLHRPRAGEGHVRVETTRGTRNPSRPIDFSWIDVVGDGRYLVRPGAELRIGPGTADTIATQIQRLVSRGW